MEEEIRKESGIILQAPAKIGENFQREREVADSGKEREKKGKKKKSKANPGRQIRLKSQNLLLRKKKHLSVRRGSESQLLGSK